MSFINKCIKAIFLLAEHWPWCIQVIPFIVFFLLKIYKIFIFQCTFFLLSHVFQPIDLTSSFVAKWVFSSNFFQSTCLEWVLGLAVFRRTSFAHFIIWNIWITEDLTNYDLFGIYSFLKSIYNVCFKSSTNYLKRHYLSLCSSLNSQFEKRDYYQKTNAFIHF